MSPLSIPDARLANAMDARSWRVEVAWGATVQTIEPGALLRVPSWERHAGEQWQGRPRLTLGGAAEVALAAMSSDARSLLDALRRNGDAVLRLFLLIGEDEAPMFQGVVSEWRLAGGELVVRAKTGWPWDDARTICRNLALLPEGRAAKVESPAWIPQVFGEVAGVAAPPLFRAASVRAAASVPLVTGEIALEVLPGWPKSGTVQIEDELLFYKQLLDDPPRIASLDRATPREHSGRPQVHLLPAGSLAWVVADHDADVVELRGGSPDGVAASPFLIEARSIGGRDATCALLNALPLDVRLALLPSAWDSTADPEFWEIGGGTDCFSPFDAFSDSAKIKGAYFYGVHPILRASWTKDLSATALRFARLEKLWFEFELDANSFWRPQTRLQVTLTKGEASVVSNLDNLGNLIDPGHIDQVVALAPPVVSASVAVVPNVRRVAVDFDAVTDDARAAWTNATRALIPSFEDWATREETETGAARKPLALRLLRDRIGQSRSTGLLGLFARVRAEAPTTVTLRLHVPGKRLDERTLAVGTAWTTIGDLISGPAISASDLLAPGAAFSLLAETGRTLDVAAVWLELGFEEASPASSVIVAPQTVTLDAAVAQPLQGHPVRIDARALFEGDPSWDLFAPGDDPLGVEFLLVDAHERLVLNVRKARWTAQIRKPTSVQPTPRLFATVRGRATGDDGTCDPADVVETLLTDAAFGALESPLFDTASLEALSARNVAAERRFRRAIAGSESLRDAVEAALAECGGTLLPTSTGWRVGVIEQADLASPDASLGAGDLLEFAAPESAEPAANPAGRLALVAAETGATLAEVGTGERAVAWEIQWLVSKAQEPAEEWLARSRATRSRVALRIADRWLGCETGARLKFPDPHESQRECRGVIVKTSFVDARLAVEMDVQARGFIAWSQGDAALWCDVEPPRLVLVIGNRAVAVWSAARLTLRGTLGEQYDIDAPGGGIHFDEDAHSVTFTTGGAAARFTQDGGLNLSGTLSAGFAITGESVPENGVALAESGIVFGVPGAALVGLLRQSDGCLLVSGELKEEDCSKNRRSKP